MSLRGSNAPMNRESDRERLAGMAAQAWQGASAGIASARDRADSILGTIAAGIAQTRAAAAALRDLSAVEDHILRDIGLNRTLIERSEYRIEKRSAPEHGIRH